jgi:beta-glucanase (GH16 family)
MTKYTSIFLPLVFLLSACNMSTSGDLAKDKTAGKFKLVWQDEFGYTGLPDTTKWTYDTEGNDAGWGNNESQFYTKANLENARVEDGKLKITALHKARGGKEFTSARLISKADWKYGRIEVSAKVPDGNGTWSAIWMMPGGWRFSDGNWPDVGEIDILEHVGHETGVIHASAHSKDYQWQKGTQKTGITNVPTAAEEFHVYALEWDQDVMKVSVDDSLFFAYENEGLGESKWPFDKPFSLIMNIAVGGAWGIKQGIDTTAFPQTMEIDYVRVFQEVNRQK